MVDPLSSTTGVTKAVVCAILSVGSTVRNPIVVVHLSVTFWSS